MTRVDAFSKRHHYIYTKKPIRALVSSLDSNQF